VDKINIASLEHDLWARWNITPQDIYAAIQLEHLEGIAPRDSIAVPELEELRDMPLHIEIDLLPQDANALRMKLHQLTMQGIIWQDESTRLSNLMMAVVCSKPPADVVKEIIRQGPERARNANAMISSFVQDFRLALLCSPDQDGDALEHYFPEYKGRWRYVEPTAIPVDPGAESGGSGGNLESVGGS
jgi:hypothetical protein